MDRKYEAAKVSARAIVATVFSHFGYHFSLVRHCLAYQPRHAFHASTVNSYLLVLLRLLTKTFMMWP